LPYIKYYDVKNIPGVTCETGIQLNENNLCSYSCKKTLCKCNNLGYNTKHGFFCNKHIKYTFKEDEEIEKIDNKDLLNCKKLPIYQLKKLLKQNNLKQTGNKEDLIIRILINKIDYTI